MENIKALSIDKGVELVLLSSSNPIIKPVMPPIIPVTIDTANVRMIAINALFFLKYTTANNEVITISYHVASTDIIYVVPNDLALKASNTSAGSSTLKILSMSSRESGNRYVTKPPKMVAPITINGMMINE